MIRQMYPSAGAYQQSYNKNMQYPLVGANSYGYVPASTIQQQHMIYNANMGQYGVQRIPKNQMMSANVGPKILQRGGAPPAGFQKNNGYQLKVGGVVVGSWANNSRISQASRMNRAGMVRTQLTHFRHQINFPLISDSLSNQSAITSWCQQSF